MLGGIRVRGRPASSCRLVQGEREGSAWAQSLCSGERGSWLPGASRCRSGPSEPMPEFMEMLQGSRLRWGPSGRSRRARCRDGTTAAWPDSSVRCAPECGAVAARGRWRIPRPGRGRFISTGVCATGRANGRSQGGHRLGDGVASGTREAPVPLRGLFNVSTHQGRSLVGSLASRARTPACPGRVGHHAHRHPRGWPPPQAPVTPTRAGRSAQQTTGHWPRPGHPSNAIRRESSPGRSPEVRDVVRIE